MNSIRIAVGGAGIIGRTRIGSIGRGPGFPPAVPSGTAPATGQGCRDARPRHVGDVIAGKAAPGVSLVDELENMRAIEAPCAAAREKQHIEIDAPEEIGTPDLIQTKGRI